MDNYEWNHGMTMHFGMYGVDAKDPSKIRHARPAAMDYGRIAKMGSIPMDLVTSYPAPK
jgi:beta-glucosidase/6-phospho-beta-glucosidase/beta-galactosidase